MTASPTLTRLEDLSPDRRGFFVPQFEVRIENAGLPRDVLADVREITYQDDVDQFDTFSLVVSNVDDIHHALPQADRAGHTQRRYKYIGSETEEELQGGETALRYKLFEPCARNVEIRMGYLGALELMMTGNFTTMAPRFLASGASTLEVRGINVLHQLRRKKYSEHWLDTKRSDIAEAVGERRRRGNDDTRLELPVLTDPGAKSREEAIPLVAQKNEYDVDFLWKLARAEGYVVAIREATEGEQRHLYFGPSGGLAEGGAVQEPVTYDLRLGTSLIEIAPRLTSANQFRSVTVKGWNRDRQREIVKTVDLDDRELRRLNPNLHELLKLCDPREELVVEWPVFTEREAEERARAILTDQHKQMATVSCTTVGLPRLRAGSTVEIGGIGSRLSGTYFVTKTTHTINDRGYLTKFEARREQIGEATP